MNSDETNVVVLVTARGIEWVGNSRLSKYRFAHNLFQRYLYNGLDAAEQAFVHEAVAQELERLYADQLEVVAVQLARHYEAAGLVAEAVTYWQRAGEEAVRVHAHAEAITSFRPARWILSRENSAMIRRRLNMILGRSRCVVDSSICTHNWDEYWRLTPELARALALYREMTALAESRGDRRLELAALMAQAIPMVTVTSTARDVDEGGRLLARAHLLASELGDQAAEARILWAMFHLHAYTSRTAQALVYGQRSLALARQLKLTEQAAWTLGDLGTHLYYQQIEFEQAEAVLHESLAIWRELDNQPMLADNLSTLVLIAVYNGAYAEAIARADKAHEISRSIGNLWGQSYSRMKLGLVYWEMGQIDLALATMMDVLELSERAGFWAPQYLTRSDLARLYAELGAAVRSLDLARRVERESEEQKLPAPTAALGTVAYVKALHGNIDEAEVAIAKGKADFSRMTSPVWYAPVPLADATIALRRQDYSRAQAAAQDLLQLGLRV